MCAPRTLFVSKRTRRVASRNARFGQLKNRKLFFGRPAKSYDPSPLDFFVLNEIKTHVATQDPAVSLACDQLRQDTIVRAIDNFVERRRICPRLRGQRSEHALKYLRPTPIFSTKIDFDKKTRLDARLDFFAELSCKNYRIRLQKSMRGE